jgi:hypothetical protein
MPGAPHEEQLPAHPNGLIAIISKRSLPFVRARQPSRSAQARRGGGSGHASAPAQHSKHFSVGLHADNKRRQCRRPPRNR